MTIDTGISLQALVTRELLVSIFNPKSPLHDGAVIIENQIITAARCVLPLSVTTKIDSGNLGTRHRAGLGISEQSDSIVLIVSEETGAISLAREGNLIHNISIELLPNLLQSHLSSRSYSELQSSL
jgi:diadenylate cyclase